MIAEDTLTILRQLTGEEIDQERAQSLFRDIALMTHDSPAPQAMVAGLMEKLQLEDRLDQANQSDYIFTDILARDKHTGYYIHSALRTLYLDYALVRSSQKETIHPPLLVLGDFLNLSSVNEALGRSITNDMMATICGIYCDAMTRHGVVNWLYHRSMGDEVTFIVMDCDQAQVETALATAAHNVQEFVKVMGIERLRHKKYPNQSGTGLITAVKPLTPDTEHRTLKQELDEIIQEVKKQGKATLFNRVLGVEPEQFHNHASEMRVDKALHKYEHYRQLAQHIMGPLQPDMKRTAMNPAAALLTGRAIAWPRDDRIEFLRHHHDGSKMMLRADIYNLGGLNAVFGHDGADHIKAHYIRLLYDALKTYDTEDPKIFDCGGGIIDAIFNVMAPQVLEQTICTIQNQIYFQVLQHTVASYAEEENLAFAGDGTVRLASLPHPRHEVEGTGLIMALHRVEKERSLPEIIERLDKITNRTKMHGFSCLWHGVDGNVNALMLNQEPHIVPIGKDRKREGHYLPFTDALRDHIHPENLPSIFERPIGQICEIIFGVDMQAVLGFKKAIRMLQEKNVDDDAIEAIASYEAMDTLLKQHDLPPLSVVSTQNRPALVMREREAFKTMTLAGKLEKLPSELATILLQIQGVFYSLKFLRPHGQLPFGQAQQILFEELSEEGLSKISGERAHNTTLSESLLSLTRLFDRSYACLQRPWPDKLLRTWHDLCMGCLQDNLDRLHHIDEKSLAHLLERYLEKREKTVIVRQEALQTSAIYYTEVIDHLLTQSVINAEQAEQLEDRFNSLFKRLHRALVEIAPDEKITVYA
jgi:hypothetical protein